MKKNTLITNILFLLLLSLHINICSITEKQKWIGCGVGVLFLYNAVTYAFQEESRKKDIETFDNDINMCNNIKEEFSKIPDPEDNKEAIENFNNTIHKMIFINYFSNLNYILGGGPKLVDYINNLEKQHNSNQKEAYCDYKNNVLPQHIDEYLKPMMNNKKYAEENPRKYNFGKLKKDKWWIEQNMILSCFIGMAYYFRRK